jgi:hypothetical protein
MILLNKELALDPYATLTLSAAKPVPVTNITDRQNPVLITIDPVPVTTVAVNPVPVTTLAPLTALS